MAVVRLTDVIVPEVFYPYMQKETTEKSEIFTSGILRQDANMASFLAGGGVMTNVPFWNDLDNTEADPASDDPTEIGVPGKIGSSKDMARRIIRTRGWSSARLVSELAGSDPMKAIGNRVSDYWKRQYQRQLVATLYGLYLDNVASNGGDMVVNIATDASGAPTPAQIISAQAVIDTKQTMGDAADSLRAVIMHSVNFSRLQKQNLIEYIPNSRGEINFATYLGYRVIVDDGMKVITGVNRVSYLTCFLGEGAIAWAESPVAIPVEIDREPSQGNGMGVDTLWTRRQTVMHPYGIKWLEASVAAEFPTNAELSNPNNWQRVYAERRQIPIAFLVSN